MSSSTCCIERIQPTLSGAEEMQLIKHGDLLRSSDMELIGRMLSLDGSRLLELGCGAALTTRLIAEGFPVAGIVAAEVDEIQHAKNLAIDDLHNVEFKLAGMQAIPEPDASFDAVVMLKSLHHVSVDQMAQGFAEIHRVLKASGLVYISEPVYAGEFNEILRLFHDEQRVRQAAFDAIKDAVDSGRFELVEELHFLSESRFRGFAEFEHRILGATHSEFEIDASVYAEIERRFESHLDAHGIAVFLNPTRVDLLRKAEHSGSRQLQRKSSDLVKDENQGVF
jgi:ubiquinone/menaquinone biosynthesis C-methylase UbiE